MEATWRPHEKHGDLTERSDLPDSVFDVRRLRFSALAPLTRRRRLACGLSAVLRRPVGVRSPAQLVQSVSVISTP